MTQTADDFMRAGQPDEALLAYQSAWSQLPEGTSAQERVWHLLALANAAIRHGDHAEAYNALHALFKYYSQTGIVVGNPLFHLLIGLALHGLGEDAEDETDNFARALICGGPGIFCGENPAHLERIKKLLLPPAELGTWEGYQGCSQALLNGATGYLLELVTKKIGAAPPYDTDE